MYVPIRLNIIEFPYENFMKLIGINSAKVFFVAFGSKKTKAH